MEGEEVYGEDMTSAWGERLMSSARPLVFFRAGASGVIRPESSRHRFRDSSRSASRSFSTLANFSFSRLFSFRSFSFSSFIRLAMLWRATLRSISPCSYC